MNTKTPKTEWYYFVAGQNNMIGCCSMSYLSGVYASKDKNQGARLNLESFLELCLKIAKPELQFIAVKKYAGRKEETDVYKGLKAAGFTKGYEFIGGYGNHCIVMRIRRQKIETMLKKLREKPTTKKVK